MADQQQQRPYNEGNPAPPAREIYQYAFDYSEPSSRSGSYIEPDPQAECLLDSSMSLTESIFNFPRKFGRTYHAYREGSYAFPNDKAEQERLALQDTAFTKAMGNRLFFAPLNAHPPRRILDIATGTGDWAIAMGDIFTEATVIATDLSPIQPDAVPPNVEFYVEDSSEPWDFSEPFDYIHTKTTGACWESYETQIAKQAFDTLSPGGWFESQESLTTPKCDDGTFKEDSALSLWFLDFTDAAAEAKRPLTEAANLKSMYERVGFVDIHERIFKVPLNGWPKDMELKEVGLMMEMNMQMGLSAFSLSLFNRIYRQTPAEIEVSLMDVRREVSDPSIHAYLPLYVVWGRKPFPGEQ